MPSFRSARQKNRRSEKRLVTSTMRPPVSGTCATAPRRRPSECLCVVEPQYRMRTKPAVHCRSPQARRRPPARFPRAPANRSNKPRARRSAPRAMPRPGSHAAARPAGAGLPAAAGAESRDCGPAFPCRCTARPPAPDRRPTSSCKHRSVGEAAFHAAGIRGQALAQRGEPLWAGLAGHNPRLGVALGEDERLASGRRARIEDAFRLSIAILRGARGQLRDQLRAFVLHARAALANGRRRCHIA